MLFWKNLKIKNAKAIPNLQFQTRVNKNYMIKRKTLQSERAFCHHSLNGSMTVEAAIVVPMVFFVWIACIALTSVVKVGETVQNELTNTVLQLGIAAGTYGDIVEKGGTLGAWASIGRLEGLETGGVEKVYGFDFSESEIMTDDDWILLKVRYRIRLLEGLIPIPEIRMVNQVYVRAWTGCSPEENAAAASESLDQVFVAEHGQVYHKDRMCSHIRLKIYMADVSETKGYMPCEKCIGGSTDAGDTYYVTESGDCYHSRLGCSGLKRTVEQVELESALAKGCVPCSRCGGE